MDDRRWTIAAHRPSSIVSYCQRASYSTATSLFKKALNRSASASMPLRTEAVGGENILTLTTVWERPVLYSHTPFIYPSTSTTAEIQPCGRKTRPLYALGRIGSILRAVPST